MDDMTIGDRATTMKRVRGRDTRLDSASACGGKPLRMSFRLEFDSLRRKVRSASGIEGPLKVCWPLHLALS